MHELISPTLNLVILISIMVYYLKKPAVDFIEGRHTLLRDELRNVRDQLKLAQEKYDEFSAKLKAIDSELASLREQGKQEAQNAKVRISSEAKDASKNIVTDARSGAESLYAELRGKLYAELSTRVLERAETLLRDRLTGDDRARLKKEFSKQVESIQ